jgi:hypothetical protein
MSDSDDLSGDDPEMDKFVEDFERHRDALYDCVLDYMDEEEIDEAYVAQLLMDAMIRMRMTAYGLGVESPSVGGLRMDLDRLKDEVNAFLREAKKGAEEYIVHVKEMRAAAEKALAAVDEELEGDEADEEDDEDDEEEGDEEADEEKPK